MSTPLRPKNNQGFIEATEKSFGKEFTKRAKCFGFSFKVFGSQFNFSGLPIGDKQVNTAKVVESLVPGRIAAAAVQKDRQSISTLAKLGVTVALVATGAYLAVNNQETLIAFSSSVSAFAKQTFNNFF